MTFTAAAPDDNTIYFANFTDSAAVRCRIYSDGDLQNHDNSYGAISDSRLKSFIQDARSQLADFRQYRFRNYKLNSDIEQYGDEAPWQIGLIAQEVLPISPGLVLDHGDHYGLQYSVLAVKNAKDAKTDSCGFVSERAVNAHASAAVSHAAIGTVTRGSSSNDGCHSNRHLSEETW